MSAGVRHRGSPRSGPLSLGERCFDKRRFDKWCLGGKCFGKRCVGALCSGVLYLALYMALSLPVLAADKYFTWVDQNGQLRTTVIHEADQPNPIEEQAAKHRQDETAKPGVTKAPSAKVPPEPLKSSSAVSVPKRPASGVSTSERGAIPQESSKQSSAAPSEAVQPAPAKVAGKKTTVVDTGSPASNGAETPAGKGGAKPLASKKAAHSNTADSEYNLKNYPDGDTLAKHGFVRDKSHRPYFTWVDAENNLRSSFYQPPPFEEKAPPKGAGRLEGVAFNRASVLSYKPAAPVDLPKDAAPDISKVLGLNRAPGFLAAFSESCCDTLQKGDIADLPPDRNFLVKVEDSDPVFDFSSGKSYYRWVKLPGDRLPYALRLRSFIHNGVFVPTLVFFDSQFRITRLITDISFDYAPERWYRYGYLQATFPVYPGRGGDRWLLVLTRKRDLHQKTVVDHENRVPPIRHTATGSLELAVVSKP